MKLSSKVVPRSRRSSSVSVRECESSDDPRGEERGGDDGVGESGEESTEEHLGKDLEGVCGREREGESTTDRDEDGGEGRE